MSGQKLLNENTIRRFMKLANTGTFSDNFVTEKYGMAPAKKKDLDEEVEETNEEINEEEEVELEEQEEVEAGEELGDEMEMDMDMDMEMDADMDAEPEMGAADMSLTEEEADVLIALGERLSAAMRTGEDELASDDMGDADDLGMDDAAGEEPAASDDEEAAMMENEDELVQEVLKRVTRRLVDAKINSRK